MLALRERFMRDGLSTRLGGLAANLRRMHSFAAHEAGREAVASLIEESKYFIEWTAASAPVETAAQLVDLQVELARWQLTGLRRWTELEDRQKLAARAKVWSDRILQLSGLIQPPSG